MEAPEHRLRAQARARRDACRHLVAGPARAGGRHARFSRVRLRDPRLRARRLRLRHARGGDHRLRGLAALPRWCARRAPMRSSSSARSTSAPTASSCRRSPTPKRRRARWRWRISRRSARAATTRSRARATSASPPSRSSSRASRSPACWSSRRRPQRALERIVDIAAARLRLPRHLRLLGRARHSRAGRRSARAGLRRARGAHRARRGQGGRHDRDDAHAGRAASTVPGVNVLLYGTDTWLIGQRARGTASTLYAQRRRRSDATCDASSLRRALVRLRARTASRARACATTSRATSRTILVDGDLLGHTTHGLALLPGYLDEIEKGTMRERRRADGRRMRAPPRRRGTATGCPGPGSRCARSTPRPRWRARYGTGTVVDPPLASHRVPRRLSEARDRSRADAALVHCSDPSIASVAPFGGVSPVFTPNPLAGGHSDVGRSDPARHLGELHDQRPHRAPAQGAARSCRIRGCRTRRATPTADPAVLFNEPKGTLLPLGGLDAGHKGYALALLVEALTAGLAGFGRADPPEGWGATVFVQVLDPAAFGGRDAFARQIDLARRRLPRRDAAARRSRACGCPASAGSRAMREQREHGVALHPTILPALAPWAEKLGVASPTELTLRQQCASAAQRQRASRPTRPMPRPDREPAAARAATACDAALAIGKSFARASALRFSAAATAFAGLQQHAAAVGGLLRRCRG